MTPWTKVLTAVPFFAAPGALRAAPSSAALRWRACARWTLLLLLLLPAPACKSAFWQSDFWKPQPAAPAVVSDTMAGCEWFLAQPADDAGRYILMELTWGDMPEEGDTLVGLYYSFESYDVINQTTKAEISVDIEDYSLGSPEALTRLQKNCCLSYNPVGDC